MKKILFFVAAPFCQRDYQRYGIDIFIKNGFDIYVWDITFAVYPELKGKLVPSDPLSWDKHITFFSKQEVIAALNQCSPDTFIVNTVAYDGNTFDIYRAISRKKIPYSINPVWVFVPVEGSVSAKNKFNRILKIFNLVKLRAYLIRKIPLKYLNINPATFVIAEGLKSNIHRAEVTAKTTVLRTHSLNYDVYLSMQNEPARQQNVAVFLDNYLPFHTDAAFSNEKSPVTPDIYFNELRRFFDFLEAQCKIKIIIAAHPRAKYEEHGDLYAGREIIKNKTAELVKNASFVIANFSTSISFAVLFKKPVVFFTTDELNDTQNTMYNYKKFIADIASSLGKTPINISENLDSNKIDLNIDELKYNEYRNNYIKVDGSKNLPFWQIICNEINDYSLRSGDAKR